MSDAPTLLQRAEEGARRSLCLYRSTDGFCGGENPDCKRCGTLGAQIGRDVLRHIRPTMRRLLMEKGVLLSVEDVLGIIDEAVETRPPRRAPTAPDDEPEIPSFLKRLADDR